MAEKVFSNRIKRANRSAGRAICMPKSMVLLAVFIVLGLLLIPYGSTITNSQAQIYSYNIVSNDPNYLFDDSSISYANGKLIIEFTLKTNYSGYSPSASYVGLTAGVDLASMSKLYTWNNSWIDRTGNIDYIAQKTIKGKTYDHIYYYAFGMLPDFWSKEVKLEITATKQQLKSWIESDNNLIVYFGEATSVIKITEGAVDQITTGEYYVEFTENAGSSRLLYRAGNTDDWAENTEGIMTEALGQYGLNVVDGVVTRDEVTDMKVILDGTGYGTEDRTMQAMFLPEYFMYNYTFPTPAVSYVYATLGFTPTSRACVNTSGLQNYVTGIVQTNVTQKWLAVTNPADEEALCFIWNADPLANNSFSVRTTPTTMQFLIKWNGAKLGEWNWLTFRFYMYNYASADYWDECQAFWDKTQDSMTFTETKGTSYEIDKGLEYGIIADANDEIDVKISQGNGNQTHVMLTLDFANNLTWVNITNSTSAITSSTPTLNNFTLTGSDYRDYNYTENATGEAANISTCFVSNITSNTRCYVYLPFDSDIYLVAEQFETLPTVSVNFVNPTLSNTTYTPNNYIEANASVSENVTSCLLEWDDGSPSNDSMAITNDDSNTYCWLNKTGIADKEYLFNVYANTGSNLGSSGQRNITVDTTSPTVTITSPNVTEISTEIDINFTAIDTNLLSCYYSFDGGTNTSITSCANTTISATAGGHTIEVYAHDSAGNIGGSTVSFTIIAFSLAVYNATDNSTITSWHLYIVNGSNGELKRYNNNNTFQLNISDVPVGLNNTVEMTIWKENHGNATFNFTNNFTSALIFERHIIGDNLFVNLFPANNSIQFADQSFTMNISIPNYAEGNASIWYAFNRSSTYILGCSECNDFSRAVTFGPGAQTIFALINNSQYYLGVNGESKTHNVTVYNSKFNITILDEITNKSINFATKNGTLEFFCSDRTVTQSVTGTLHEYLLNCTGNLERIKFKLFDPNGDHYRELIPTFRIGNLTFYMINTTPADVTVNLVTYLVTDASLLYQSGIMHFKKIILTEGQKDIIDTIIGSDGKVYAYLIGGETYTLSVESADGTNSKTLGEYTTPDTTTTSQPLTIIDVRFIPTTYNYIGTDISWEMQFNTTMGKIYFYWNDSTEQTNSIKFWIYNITNVTARTQMYFDSVSDQSHHLFQWDYVTNGNENDTYLGYFEVIHGIHGNITESRPLAKDGIFYPWLGNIGAWYHIFSVFIIVFVASIFGAKSAPIGAIILAIIAGFLFYIKWLPSIMAGVVRLTDLLMLSLIALSILAMFIIKRRRV